MFHKKLYLAKLLIITIPGVRIENLAEKNINSPFQFNKLNTLFFVLLNNYAGE